MRVKVRQTRNQIAVRLAIATHVAELLEECRMANPEHFPRLGTQVRMALRSARAAARSAEAAMARFDEGRPVHA